MMSKIILNGIYTVISAVIVYLIACFVMWDLTWISELGKMNPLGRGFAFVFFFLLFALVYTTIKIIESEVKDDQ